LTVRVRIHISDRFLLKSWNDILETNNTRLGPSNTLVKLGTVLSVVLNHSSSGHIPNFAH
jgi:hypothetical protein